MIIGLSGTFGAGKDTISQYLVKKGFQHISLSDIIRAEAKKRRIGHDRDSLRELGNVLVKENGEEVLAKIAMQRQRKPNLVLSSIRRIKEIDYLHTFKDFKFLFVDAPIKIRYGRLHKRGRIGEGTMSFEDFKTKEKLEMSGKSTQRLDLCKKKADVLINNSKTEKHLFKQIDKIITKEAYAK